jgi:anti-sigma factor RsiW
MIRFGRRRSRVSCKEVGRLLQSYLDDEDTGDRSDQIRAHLADCRRCGLEAEAYRRIMASLADQAEPLPEASIERLRGFARALASGGEQPLP